MSEPFVLLQPRPFAVPANYSTGGTTGAKGDPGGNVMAVGLFSAASGLTIPTGTDIVQTAGYSASGTGHALYVADAAVDAAWVSAHPSAGFVSANSRGFRLSAEQRLNVKMFGAKGDGTTNDGAAFVAAIAYLKFIAGNDLISEFKASGALFVPAGHYYLGTTTLDITHNLIIEGEGGIGIGSGGGVATKLRWDANTTGIRIQSEHTSGASTYDASAHYGGGSSTFRNLYLGGPAADTTGSLNSLGLTEGEYHGFHVKASAFFEHCMVEGFQGDGLHAYTTSGAGDSTEGYSNCSRAYNCVFKGNRAGVFVKGGDANVWTFIGCQANYNRACGVDDQSFLGNTHIGWHTNGNGVYLDNLGTSSFPAYVVSNGGNRYCPVQGQEATASTTAPSGTADTSVWLYVSAGGVTTGYPAWTSGMSLRCAAPYRSNGFSGRTIFQNCYSESNQGLSQFVHPTLIFGGLHGAGDPRGDGVYLRNELGSFTVDTFLVKSTSVFDNPLTTTSYMNFEDGSFTYNGRISSNTAFRMLALDGYQYVSFTINGTSIANFQSSGLDLASGKTLSINGTKVVDSRFTKPGTPALSDVIACLDHHGLWG
jgi:hypothetical protein